MSAAAISLWVLVIIIVIGIIIWMACMYCGQSKNKRQVRAVVIEEPRDNRFASAHDSGNWGAPSTSSTAPDDLAPAVDPGFPVQEDDATRFPHNRDLDGGLNGGDPFCASSGKGGLELDVNHLMPASWRTDSKSSCGAETEDDTYWTAYAPSKEAFNNYLTTAGSARLAVNSRSALARVTGLPNLLRQGFQSAGSGPVPISSDAVLFNDSDFRQTLVFNSTGSYPQLPWC